MTTNKMKKISMNVPEDVLNCINEAVKDIPAMPRSQFMIDCALTVINNSCSLPLDKQKDILPHLAELSNLINELANGTLKEEMQKEVMCLWQSLK